MGSLWTRIKSSKLFRRNRKKAASTKDISNMLSSNTDRLLSTPDVDSREQPPEPEGTPMQIKHAPPTKASSVSDLESSDQSFRRFSINLVAKKKEKGIIYHMPNTYIRSKCE